MFYATSAIPYGAAPSPPESEWRGATDDAEWKERSSLDMKSAFKANGVAAAAKAAANGAGSFGQHADGLDLTPPADLTVNKDKRLEEEEEEYEEGEERRRRRERDMVEEAEEEEMRKRRRRMSEEEELIHHREDRSGADNQSFHSDAEEREERKEEEEEEEEEHSSCSTEFPHLALTVYRCAMCSFTAMEMNKFQVHLDKAHQTIAC